MLAFLRGESQRQGEVSVGVREGRDREKFLLAFLRGEKSQRQGGVSVGLPEGRESETGRSFCWPS